MPMKKILVMNGPNLDMLGVREPNVYGNDTLVSLESQAMRYGAEKGVEVTCYQSNSEEKLISQIHHAPDIYDAIVYNPGAHTHYSYALRDAIGSVDIPVVEVHISDVSDREPFRRISVTAPACVARVKGLGFESYLRAIDVLLEAQRFERLGEGYQRVYDDAADIIVGGRDKLATPAPAAAPAATPGASTASAAVPAPTPAAAAGGSSSKDVQAIAPDDPFASPSPESKSTSAQPDAQPASAFARDFTEPYRPEIEAQDAGAISTERLSLLRTACARLGIGAMLVRDTPNIHWLTALDGVFDDERAHALLVAANLALLHTDSRYRNACQSALAKTQSDVTLSDLQGSAIEFAFDVLNQPDQEPFSALLGIEDTITYAEFVKTVEAFGADLLAPTSDVVLGLRAVKSESEIVRLRAAQAVTDAAFKHIVSYMKPGMTEREVQIELDCFMERHGAEGLAFPTIVACGENAADPHAIASSKRLEAGQCVVMDFGAKAFGYCSDMTRTVFLGRPSREMTSAWDALRSANEQVEAMLAPGVTGKQAHELAERALAEGGFARKMGHGLGHGVGLEIHELPVLSPRNATPLVAGNVVTVEPGIYLPGKFGMRLEDFGVITEEGFDVFTQSTHEMVII